MLSAYGYRLALSFRNSDKLDRINFFKKPILASTVGKNFGPQSRVGAAIGKIKNEDYSSDSTVAKQRIHVMASWEKIKWHITIFSLFC